MAPDPLSVLGGLLLLFLAPGFLLLEALFPGRRWFAAFHPVALPLLSVIVSVGILVVAGSVLGFTGNFSGHKTGAPVLELTLGGLCVVLFAVAWWRGAFGLLPSPRGRGGAGRAPVLSRGKAEPTGWVERGEPEEVTLLRDLRLEEERLRRETRRIRKRARTSRDSGVRSALGEAADDLEREREAVAARAADVERRAGERRYGQEAKPRWVLGGRGR
ncbi:MAG TPA: hypothetical protein VNX21_07460 [Candidatus Thermoplasmatota archaeon]|nr:hypothetical protein [Candidatus Thermoplasmatota archaeon]